MISVWLVHCSGLQLVADSAVWCTVQRGRWTTVWTLQRDVQDYLWRGHYICQKCEYRKPMYIHVAVHACAVTCNVNLYVDCICISYVDQIWFSVFLMNIKFYLWYTCTVGVDNFSNFFFVKYVSVKFIFDEEEYTCTRGNFLKFEEY